MEKLEMKNIKGWLTGGVLAAILMMGSTVAKAEPGIIFGLADGPCTSTNDNGGIIFGNTNDGSTDDNGNGGIIFGNGGIIFGTIGIIFGNSDDTSNCG